MMRKRQYTYAVRDASGYATPYDDMPRRQTMRHGQRLLMFHLAAMPPSRAPAAACLSAHTPERRAPPYEVFVISPYTPCYAFSCLMPYAATGGWRRHERRLELMRSRRTAHVSPMMRRAPSTICRAPHTRCRRCVITTPRCRATLPGQDEDEFDVYAIAALPMFDADAAKDAD